MVTLNHEERLLVELITRANPVNPNAIPAPMPSEDDWSRVAQTAQQHRIEGLFFESIKALGLANELPTCVADSLRGSYVQTVSANHWAFQELGALLQILTRARIPVILLKGCALATTLYGGDGLRRVGDLDLYIRHSDFTRVRALLTERGYVLFTAELARDFNSRFASEQSFWLEGEHPSQVDIHWHVIGMKYYRDRVPVDWFWHRTTNIHLDAHPAQIFSPNAQLLHLSAHFALHHSGVGLKWSYDLAMLLTRCRRQIDWSEVLDAAHDFRLTQALRLSLDTACQTWGVTIPDEISLRLRESRASWGDRIAFAMTTAQHKHALVFLDSLSAGTWTAKVSYLLWHVFPGISFMRERYRIKHALLIPLYYFWRLSEGSYRLGRSVISIVARGR